MMTVKLFGSIMIKNLILELYLMIPPIFWQQDYMRCQVIQLPKSLSHQDPFLANRFRMYVSQVTTSIVLWSPSGLDQPLHSVLFHKSSQQIVERSAIVSNNTQIHDCSLFLHMTDPSITNNDVEIFLRSTTENEVNGNIVDGIVSHIYVLKI